MTDWHPSDDLLIALALDDVDDPERESTLRHLAACRRCRSEYDAFSATLEQTLAAAPAVEPGPGFDARALAAMGFDDGVDPVVRIRPGHARPRWQLVAASVVLGLAIGAGGAAAVVTAGHGDEANHQLAAGSAFLETSEGTHVGTVTPSYVGTDPVLVVSVTAGRVGMEYQCLLRLENGKQVPTTAWVLDSDQGATWVVKTPPESPVSELVLVAHGGDGPVWSTARL